MDCATVKRPLFRDGDFNSHPCENGEPIGSPCGKCETKDPPNWIGWANFFLVILNGGLSRGPVVLVHGSLSSSSKYRQFAQ